MSFGQASGPPASAKQVAYLLSLLRKEGYDDFRDARRGLGLNQRQGGGKFTTKEASELIEQLTSGADDDADDGDIGVPSARTVGAAAGASSGAGGRTRRTSLEPTPAELLDARNEATVKGLPAGVLAGELERRGWTCAPPHRH